MPEASNINPGRKIIFVLLVVVSLVFLVWSRLVLVFIFLLIVFDFVTTGYLYSILRPRLPSIVLKLISLLFYIATPVLFAVLIRTLFFDYYYVPTASMERTISKGEYVLTNKVAYGSRIPRSWKEIPVFGNLFKSHVDTINFQPFTSLNPFKDYQREDIVVFKAIDQIDKYYVKRIVGLPTDTLLIANGQVSINGSLLPDKEQYCKNYLVTNTLGKRSIRNLSNSEYRVFLNEEANKNLSIGPDTITKGSRLLGGSQHPNWDANNYGPLIVPGEGLTVLINRENYPLYKYILENFEDWQTPVPSGNETNLHTFKQDYVFVLGDNRDGSIDSRNFGVVPFNFLQGKVVKIIR